VRPQQTQGRERELADTGSKTRKNDVSTLAGFLAEYDKLASTLRTKNRWCDVKYAYIQTDGAILPPAQRLAPAVDVPQEYLTDEGRAWVAEREAQQLTQAREGAKRAIIYGLSNTHRYNSPSHYLTKADAELACQQLGLPAPRSSRTYPVWVEVSSTLLVDRKPTDTKVQELSAGLQAAVQAYLAEQGYADAVARAVISAGNLETTWMFGSPQDGNAEAAADGSSESA